MRSRQAEQKNSKSFRASAPESSKFVPSSVYGRNILKENTDQFAETNFDQFNKKKLIKAPSKKPKSLFNEIDHNTKQGRISPNNQAKTKKQQKDIKSKKIGPLNVKNQTVQVDYKLSDQGWQEQLIEETQQEEQDIEVNQRNVKNNKKNSFKHPKTGINVCLINFSDNDSDDDENVEYNEEQNNQSQFQQHQQQSSSQSSSQSQSSQSSSQQIIMNNKDINDNVLGKGLLIDLDQDDDDGQNDDDQEEKDRQQQTDDAKLAQKKYQPQKISQKNCQSFHKSFQNDAKTHFQQKQQNVSSSSQLAAEQDKQDKQQQRKGDDKKALANTRRRRKQQQQNLNKKVKSLNIKTDSKKPDHKFNVKPMPNSHQLNLQPQSYSQSPQSSVYQPPIEITRQITVQQLIDDYTQQYNSNFTQTIIPDGRILHTLLKRLHDPKGKIYFELLDPQTGLIMMKAKPMSDGYEISYTQDIVWEKRKMAQYDNIVQKSEQSSAQKRREMAEESDDSVTNIGVQQEHEVEQKNKGKKGKSVAKKITATETSNQSHQKTDSKQLKKKVQVEIQQDSDSNSNSDQDSSESEQLMQPGYQYYPYLSFEKCAYLVSNFFRTQFTCYKKTNVNGKKESGQKKRHLYGRQKNQIVSVSSPSTSDIDKMKKILQVNYDTNFFGFKGPRIMTVYLPDSDFLVTGSKTLKDAYEKEKERQGKKEMQRKLQQEDQRKKGCFNNSTAINTPNYQKVYKLVNKKPMWCNEISAFVLNFQGRADVSSVKNFIITQESYIQDYDGLQGNYLLFGKTQKDLFNLDIKHPFSILQAIALALSSFDV